MVFGQGPFTATRIKESQNIPSQKLKPIVNLNPIVNPTKPSSSQNFRANRLSFPLNNLTPQHKKSTNDISDFTKTFNEEKQEVTF